MPLYLNKIIFFNIPNILIILLPLSLLTGPFFGDFSVSIIALTFLIYTIKNKIFFFYKSFFFKIFIIFYFLILLSSIQSRHLLFSIETSIFYIRFGIFALAIWFYLSINNKIAHYFFIILTFCFSFLIIDGFIQYFNGKNLLGYQIHPDGRVSSFFGKELILGSYISRFLPIYCALLFLHKKYIANSFSILFFTLVILLAGVLVFFSGERSSVFFYLLSTTCMIILLNKNNFYLVKIFTLVLLIISVLIFFNSSIKTRIIDSTINSITQDKNKISIFTPDHEKLYLTALQMFNQNKLFGVGPRNFRLECSSVDYVDTKCNTHPHNTYIQLLAETGIFCFLIILVLFFLLIFNLIKQFLYKMKNTQLFSDFQICILTLFLINLFPLIPTGNFFSNWLNIFYYLPIGFFLWSIDKNKTKILP
jgi:O-antigen ligase